MRGVNFIFILLLAVCPASIYSQSCNSFPSAPAMIPCSGAASSLANNVNINNGNTFSFCGSSNPTYSNVNLSGGSIYICGNATISSGNFNSGRIYVACGATLTFSSSVTFSGNLGIINYGTVQINGNLTFQNGGCYLYNQGYSSKTNITGNFSFPANQVVGYLRNQGKLTVGGTLDLGAGGLVCAGGGSVITTQHFSYGTSGGNCNSNDAAHNNFIFNGAALEQTILRYTGTARLKGRLTSSSRVMVYRAGSEPTLPCSTSPASGWGSATVISSSIPALPAESPQTGCLVNGAVSCTSAVVLPVELLYFKADCEDNRVQLSWSTATERNNAYWTVERSTDLVNIEKIAQIPGSGNSSQILKYNFEDQNSIGELAYYRISQHDFDGKSEAFSWISIECGLVGEFNVFPNPSSGNFRITTTLASSGETDYALLDYSGKTMLSGNADLKPGQPLDLDLQHFNAGVYFLHIGSGTHAKTMKLVKL